MEEGLLWFPDTKLSPILCMCPCTQACAYAHMHAHMCARTRILDYALCSLVPEWTFIIVIMVIAITGLVAKN